MRRRKLVFFTRTGEEIEFDSVRKAAKEMHMCCNTIYKCVDYRRTIQRNGKTWHIRFREAGRKGCFETKWNPYPEDRPPKDGTYLLTVGENCLGLGHWLDGNWLGGYGLIRAWAEVPAPYNKEVIDV